jgi:hypothetical protein
MKTPEQMAEECKERVAKRDIYALGTMTHREQAYFKEAFLAGYKAAQDHIADASKKAIPDGPRFVSRNVPIFEPPEDNG